MIKIFRTILVLFCFLIFGIGSGILAFIIFPILELFKASKFVYADVVHFLWKYFVKFLEILKIIKVNFDFDNNLSGKIIVASHPSFIDIIILIGLFRNSTCFAKKDVLKNPLFKNIVKHIYIVNDMNIDEMVSKSCSYLEEGFNIIIFPSGTRTNANEDFKIHKGSALISLKSEKTIVPIKMETSYPFLTKNHSICDASNKTIIYNLKQMPSINPKEFSHLPEIKARKRICEIIKERL